MYYHDLKDLSLSAGSWDSLDKGEQDKVARLCKVYFDALQNPPEGVIGVGSITYAEDQLMSAQEDRL